MKLVLAIVQDEDVRRLMDGLTEKDFSFTRVASTGGFLRAGNTTLLIGVNDEKLDDVIGIIDEKCKTRNKIITSPTLMGGTADIFMPQPVEVPIGGATIFVIDVEKFIRV
ncbi:MAG: cyclic-di-AMP receptor [Thermoanaerobacteraceae bacterium]|nr:cyclic-di-AMP receptor [Thermoanaerobacteraceae bacterium]